MENNEIPLFETDLIYTKDELKKYTHTYLVRGNLRFLVPILYVLLVAYAFIKATGVLDFILIILPLVLVSIFFVLFLNILIGKQFNTNKLMKNQLIEYEFYPEYFRVITESSQADIRYEMIYRFMETKTNLYLMISTQESYVLLKENCSDDLLDFIRDELSNI